MSRTDAHVPERVRVRSEPSRETHRHGMFGRFGAADYCTIDESIDGSWRLQDDGRLAPCARELAKPARTPGSRRGTGRIERASVVRDTLRKAVVEYNSLGDVEVDALPGPETFCLCGRH